MKFNFKSVVILSAFLLAMTASFSQQHITNFGIVDTARVYEKFFSSSSAMRTYEKKKEEFQAEIAKRTDDLRAMQQKKLDYENIGDYDMASQTEKTIARKTENLKEFTTQKNNELATLKKSLVNKDEFYSNLSRTIKKVAENEGLSMVLSLQQSTAILWYSPSVDITDKVISALSK